MKPPISKYKIFKTKMQCKLRKFCFPWAPKLVSVGSLEGARGFKTACGKTITYGQKGNYNFYHALGMIS